MRAFNDLRDFIAALEKRGELRRVSEPVDPKLEIGEITDRVSKAGGPALLFERPIDRESGRFYERPVVINLFGSYERTALALGIDPEGGDWRDLDRLAERVMELLPLGEGGMPKSVKGKLDTLLGLKTLAEAGPREVATAKAPCQEVILRGDEVNLDALPILTTWPGDGGPFVTLPLVVTTSAQGQPNIGMYRLQRFDKNTLGLHIHEHHDGYQNMQEFFADGGERFAVSVALGADPATIFAATAPCPPIISEYVLSGIIRGGSVEVVKSVLSDLPVPARAEIVLEGYVTPGELRREGPFGDHTGYYSLADDFPVLHVEAITQRRDALYPATIVGRPPMEDCYLAKATERLFLPAIKLVVPEVLDYDLPLEGVFHNCAIFSIDKRYAGQAFKVMNAVWSLGQMMFTKFVIVVDAEVDPHDYSQVAWRCFNNVDPDRDLLISKGPLDRLDHSSNHESFGYKLGIDATRPLENEGHTRPWPEALEMPAEVKARIDKLWPTLGL